MWSLLVVTAVLVVTPPSSVVGLRCYRCNVKDNIECPGWTRDPVDTLVDLGDNNGLYTHCVTVTLADGTIVEQNPYPGVTHCKKHFVESWQYQLNQEYNQDVVVSCCEGDECNGEPSPENSLPPLFSRSSSTATIILLLLIVIAVR